MASKKKTYITYLPPDMEAVVVQYAPNLTISCVMPAEKKKILIQEQFACWRAKNCERDCNFFLNSTRLAELKAQATESINRRHAETGKERLTSIGVSREVNKLIEERGLCEATEAIATRTDSNGKVCKRDLTYRYPSFMDVDVPKLLWVYNPLDRSRETFRLYAIKDDTSSGLLGKAYQLANVYDTAAICWGNRNKVPADLFTAINSFWEAPFNKDLVRNFQYSLQHTLEKYDVFTSSIPLRDLKQDIFGSKYATRTKKATGVLVSTENRYIDAVPEKYHRTIIDAETEEQVKIIVGWLQIDLNSQAVKKEWYINVAGPGRDMGFLLKKASLTGGSKVYPLGPVESII